MVSYSRVIKYILFLTLQISLASQAFSQALSVQNRSQGTVKTTPAYYRAVKYNQPHAGDHYFIPNLDLVRFRKDLRKLKATGFNMVMLKIGWGHLIKNVDFENMTFEKDFFNLGRLKAAVKIAAEEGMLVGFTDNSPYPYEAINYGANCTKAIKYDSAGKPIPLYCGYGWAGLYTITNDDGDHILVETMIAAYDVIVSQFKNDPNVALFWLDHEHFQITAKKGHFVEPASLKSWQTYLLGKDPNLSNWNTLWQQNYTDWEDVLFPLSQNSLNVFNGFPPSIKAKHQAYLDEGVTPGGYSNPKFAEFGAWYRDTILFPYLGKFASTLKDAKPDMKIYYEVSKSKYPLYSSFSPVDETTLSVEEWNFVDSHPDIDFIAASGYPSKPFDETAEYIGQYTPGSKPLFISEFGVNPTLTPADLAFQASYLQSTLNFIAQLDPTQQIAGFNHWTAYDTYFNGSDGFSNFGLWTVDNDPKPAHQTVMNTFSNQGIATTACAASNQLKDGSFEGEFFSLPTNLAWDYKGNAKKLTDSKVSLTGFNTVLLDTGDALLQTAMLDNQGYDYELSFAARSTKLTSSATFAFPGGVPTTTSEPAPEVTVFFTWKDASGMALSSCIETFPVNLSYSWKTLSCSPNLAATQATIELTTVGSVTIDDVDLVCIDQ